MKDDEYVLGISSHFHDSAATLVQGQRIVAAAQEERFTRKKADWGFPDHAIRYCLSQLPDPDQRVSVAFYENPQLKLERVFRNARSTAPRGAALWPQTLRMMCDYGQDLSARLLTVCDDPDRIFFVPHHRSHAASAFYPSPFDTAAVLVVDGVGEWSTTSLWNGADDRLMPLSEIRFPHSLGLFYSAFTQYCGFRVNSGEYKLMGLAPFGKPRFAKRIMDNLIDLKDDGSFELDMSYFRFDTDVTTISPLFEMLFDRPVRQPDSPMDRHYMDVAASAQAVLQDALARLASTTLRISGQKNLCLSGGVALNCVANSHLIKTVPGLENLWIQPASGDAGGALGAALDVAAHLKTKSASPDGSVRARAPADPMAGSFLGPDFDDESILAELQKSKLIWEQPDDMPGQVASALAEGLIIGHFDGRMEFGPRSLGNRSILADPRPDDMLDRVNLKIKFREGWRPFAPMVLKEHAATLFEGPTDSPYMLLISTLKHAYRHKATLATALGQGLYEPLDLMRAVSTDFSAVTHVDFSARLQTVDPAARLSRSGDILQKFYELTGCPMLLNTSFNVRGEPIICSPRDAIDCFMNTNMDCLAIGPFLVRRSAQPEWVNSFIGKKKYAAD
ncbi:carbamoyltransferase N-terminal domain-containing protein [Phaeobacter sp. J2-8]|uniref:carbamoyltransferase family protein n=1 Tax=Phaeobacter sp. J2-8 TaxID=2931394 RepID=UPI001FD45C8A|nr:carbamoyltransferase N-terminal domain-containing protein [Phaeobacter sp. J2-8]MCJ7874846.1 nodulation protein [Phaeobacter sp. J2-8]